MEHESRVADPQLSGHSSPPSAPCSPPPVFENRAPGVKERDGQPALASHTAGTAQQHARAPHKPPQTMQVHRTQAIPKTSGRVELAEHLESRPSLTWQRETSKTPINSTSSSALREGIIIAARGTRTAFVSGQVGQQPHQRNFNGGAVPSMEANHEIDIDASRKGQSLATPPSSSWDLRLADQDQSTNAQIPVKEGRDSDPNTSSTGFPTPANRSPPDSDKDFFVPQVVGESSRRASVAENASTTLRSSPVPPCRNVSPELTSVSENGSECSHMSTASSASPSDLPTPQLKLHHTFNPPWMKKKRKVKNSDFLPLTFESSRDQVSQPLRTSTWWRKPPFHAGKLHNGASQGWEPFRSLRSPLNTISSSTERFFTEKNVGVKVKSALLQAGIVWPRIPKDGDSIDLLRTLLHASLKLRWSAVLHASIEHGPNVTFVTIDPLREFQRIVEKHLRMANSVRATQLYFETLRRNFGGATAKSAESTVTFTDHVKLESKYMGKLSGALHLPTRFGAHESLDVFGLAPELRKERWVAELDRYGGTSKPLIFRTKKPGYVTAFLELWRERGERDMHLFYSWCVVQIAARYASRKLLVNFYGCEDCADLYHGAFCLSKAYLLAGNQIFQEYFDGLFGDQAVKSARLVVSETVEAFALQIDAGPYRDPNHTTLHGSSFNATNVILRYFDPHFGLQKHKWLGGLISH
ncbi:uncharacterized protein LOC119181004 [Rhipicephalus microplus]|uniref:uncharacterized protein LOC119181004 n=1 Tax=Rhipicephalus microplus TaxID=6941 RepID=UPI003F6BBC46